VGRGLRPDAFVCTPPPSFVARGAKGEQCRTAVAASKHRVLRNMSSQFVKIARMRCGNNLVSPSEHCMSEFGPVDPAQWPQ
jgi:hypothetical protein